MSLFVWGAASVIHLHDGFSQIWTWLRVFKLRASILAEYVAMFWGALYIAYFGRKLLQLAKQTHEECSFK
jgi:hypothetical protein